MFVRPWGLQGAREATYTGYKKVIFDLFSRYVVLPNSGFPQGRIPQTWRLHALIGIIQGIVNMFFFFNKGSKSSRELVAQSALLLGPQQSPKSSSSLYVHDGRAWQ